MRKARRRAGVKGTDRLVRRLEWLVEAAAQQAAAETAAMADEVRDEARQNLRRAPGGLPRLAETVEVQGHETARTVIVRHPAAPFVEFGTQHMPPRPFLRPVADAATPSFRRRMKALAARLLRSRS